jgi:hypothetical protein
MMEARNMERYDFAEVWLTGTDLRLECTDSTELATLPSQLKQFYPKIKIKEEDKLVSDEIYSILIEDLPWKSERAAEWWMIKQLCLHG